MDDVITLGPLECLTTAPEIYDYGWMKTVRKNVAMDDRGKVYRLARNDDKWHYDTQIMRYGSGMNVTITDQKDLDDRVRLGFLTLTPDKAVDVHYLGFHLEDLIRSNDAADALDDAMRTIEHLNPKWEGFAVKFRIIGDEDRDKIVELFKTFNLEPMK